VTPGVNLLPARYAERLAERRWAVLTGAALLVLVAVLGLVALAQSRELGRAHDERDAEQAESARLQVQRRQLAPFRELADAIVARERLLAAALETQVSWAALLSNLARTLPSDASLTSLNAESTLPPFGAAPAAEPGRDRSIIGSTALKGYSVQEFTPGVERTLQLLATVEGLAEPRLQVGTADKIGESPVTTFEGTTFIDGAALTGRYAEGLPPEHDVDVPAMGGAGSGGPGARATGTGGTR
jgi:Tfp pilus assembly protein PilN